MPQSFDTSFFYRGNEPAAMDPMGAYQRAMGFATQQRLAEENAAGLREQRMALADQRRLEAEKRRQELADRDLMDEALRQGGGVRGATLASALKSAPHLVPALTEFFDKSAKSAADINKLENELNDKRLDHYGLTANEVLTHGLDSLPTALALHAEQFPHEADQVNALGQQLQALPPDQLRTYLEGLRNKAPFWQAKQAKNTPQVVAAGGTLVDDTGKVLYTGPPKPKSFQAKDVLIGGKPGVANFDPDSGQYFAPGSQTPLADVRPIPPASSNVTLSTPGSDADAIAQAIIAGEQPPDTKALYRAGPAVRAILGRNHYNLTTAETDWKAAQKHFATLNGAQQTRIRQAVDTASHSLDVIDQLADQWKGGRFPLLNAAALTTAKAGALGKDAQQIATALEAQISDLTSELGNVYMGGNSPTDHALGLAAKNLSANWSNDVLKTMTALARTNLQIRQNAIKNVGAIGASDSNPYVPKTENNSALTAPAARAGETVEVWVKDPTTGKYIRKGKG